MPRIAVVGDVHANAVSLSAALLALEDYCDLNGITIDKLIFIGDLLTYGVDVLETLDLIRSASYIYDTVFILGNHDYLYLDLIRNGVCRYYISLPDWIKESVDFTFSLMDKAFFLSIPFEQSFSFSQLYFAHANSFLLIAPSLDWRYINSLEDHAIHSSLLAKHDFAVGIFGHTHRRKIFLAEHGNLTGAFVDLCGNSPLLLDLSGGQSAIINVGSIGQPRSSFDLRPTLLLLECENPYQIDKVNASFVFYDYESCNHLNSIQNSSLSDETKSRLISFFRSG
jgi:predicted phosphodiesterase